MKEFKIRCSAIGNIVSGNVGLTDKQNETVSKLQDKPILTSLQGELLEDLIEKRDNPELPTGAKTYCQDWLKGQLFDYQKIISNKYTQKGNIMEDESIDFIAEHLGYGFLVKNERYFDSEFIHGTPDVVLNDLVIDAKNSWDSSTFPLFENDIPTLDYDWQLQGYMYLADKPKAKLIYTLMDTPEHLIEKEARWYSLSQGFDDLDKDIYVKFHKNMTYKNIPAKLKIKVYDIDRDDDKIKLVIDRVKMCREYIDQLKETLK